MFQLRIPVILASASPRRRELLGQLIENFEVSAPEIDEEAMGKSDPWDNAKHLACCKAFKIQVENPDKLVIGADTVVALPADGAYQMLGKPTDVEDAVRILHLLSGREHIVITGVCLCWPDGRDSWTSTSKVRFRDLTDEEIRTYVAGGEPMDKAGAYGAQGSAKAWLTVTEGSLFNVIGLPIEDFRAHLIATNLTKS